MMIHLDEPAGPVSRGSLHLRGWIADDQPFTDPGVVINGRVFRTLRYPRPDVQADYPGHHTAGFSAFVRLGRFEPCPTLAIQVVAGGEEVFRQEVPVTVEALEISRREEAVRAQKRAWILPRILCRHCGGSLDAAGVCTSCGLAHLNEDGILDCLPGARESAATEFNGAVCSHGYDGDVERILAAVETTGGMALDCGAGLRPDVRSHVVTTEIFPYPTTDILAVNERLPFRDSSFDAVLSLHVLEHVPDPFLCARELCRVLKPGGKLFAVTPMIVPEHGFPQHFFNPTRQGLARLFGRTPERARIFIPAMGHPINGVWSVIQLYRQSLPEPQRSRFDSMTIAELLARPIEAWIGEGIATAMPENTRVALAANFCIEFVKE